MALTLLLRLGRSGVLADALSPNGVPLHFGDLGLGKHWMLSSSTGPHQLSYSL